MDDKQPNESKLNVTDEALLINRVKNLESDLNRTIKVLTRLTENVLFMAIVNKANESRIAELELRKSE